MLEIDQEREDYKDPPPHAWMREVRWLVVILGLVVYWTVAGREIVRARQAATPMYFTWWAPGILTAPWSALPELVFAGKPVPHERGWHTVATTAGAIINGILYAKFVFWVTRPRRPRLPSAGDYEDGPTGAVPDGSVASTPPDP